MRSKLNWHYLPFATQVKHLRLELRSTSKDFQKFDTGQRPTVDMVTLTHYDDRFDPPVAFPKKAVKGGLGEHISNLGLKQLRAAETEKYAHVTYFFNGGREAPFPGEERLLVPSPKVMTYDLKPEMSAIPLTNAVSRHLQDQEASLVILNYANLDMVGHTGIFDAVLKAVETVDQCVGKLENLCKENDYALILTADHGNADKMFDEEGGTPFTAHTTNPIPFVVLDADVSLKSDGSLGDVAPTLLDYMGLPPGELMEGKSLIIHN